MTRHFLATAIALLRAIPAVAQTPTAPTKTDPELGAKVAGFIEKGLGFLDQRRMEKDPNLVTTDCPFALAYVHD